MNNRASNKILSLALAAVMLLGMFTAPPMTAYAVDIGTKDNMVDGDIVLGTNSSTPTQIGFGGKLWDVIGYAGDGVASESGTMTLLLTSWQGSGYPSDFVQFHGTLNQYGGSVLKTAIEDRISSYISDSRERDIILLRTLEGDSPNYNQTGYDNDKIAGTEVTGALLWPLSVKEATQLNASVRMFSNAPWWLRSPGPSDSGAAVVGIDGYVSAAGTIVSNTYAIRPAFKLNLSSVIFTSAAAGGKSVAVGDTLTSALAPTGAVKLTVLDSNASNLNLTCTDTVARTAKSGDTVSIIYSGAVAGANKYVSCVIVDDITGDVLYYGKLSDQANSTASFTVPSGLADGDYTIKLFNEEVNGNNETDYASDPVNIALEVDNTKPTVTGVLPSGTDVSTTAATLVLIFSEEIGITIAGTVTMSPDPITGTPDFTSASHWDASHKVLTIPISGLSYSTAYAITIAGFEDLSGNVMITDSTHSFKTTSRGGGSSAAYYTVTFNTNGGGSISGQSVAQNSMVTKPADPMREGYAFTGWYTDNALTRAYNFSAKVTGDFTLYAGWEENTEPGESHAAYISGYPDGTFRPDSSMTRAEAATIFYKLLGNTAETGGGFTDVSSGAWYYDAVTALSGAGIISGYEDGAFRPNSTITRAEIITMAARFAGIAAQTGGAGFPDVSDTHWAAGYIAAAADAGYVSGYPNGAFKPEGLVTRAQAVTILNRIRGCEGTPEGTSFTDMQKNHWAYKAVTAAATDHEYE